MTILFVYVTICFLILLKNQETISNQITSVSCNSGIEVVEIPRTEIKYETIEADPTEEQLLSFYMSLLKEGNEEEWFKGYKALTSTFENKPCTIYDVYTEDEIALFQRMVETEIGSAPFINRVHVADVVWNRLNSEQFPNTITGIITAPCQFTYSKNMVDETTILAIEYSFIMADTTQGAVAFHSGAATSKFFGRNLLFTDSSGHSFY